ncbi:hypothetical protein DFJ58DRAFT_85535 [Suillus subalutaceus]|uniref:uncharacterized protein n=1 Tax=Suillus subalutaceus TaxID=48586 RepID=UPI001B868627|nr:uncharacterized protein DFJ58DRAFT_85535 [Suillus subalutaceus]KAG1840933.1 hypothetical protein DFJ58DRAFT_85535 [Suillus subalutaceus]
MEMEIGPARHNPLDAQRFDPLRRTRTRLVSLFNTSTSKLMMGQGLRVKMERASVGDLWPDYEVVVNPFEAGGFDSEGSCPSPPFTLITDARATSPTPINVYDHDDIVITRTIIHPNPNPHRGPTRILSRTWMVLTRMFSCSPSFTNTYSPSLSSSSSVSPRSTPLERSTSLVPRVLNCFSTSSAFDSDADDIKIHRRERPVLLVVVKETRERYEDDRAFKEIVESVFPAGGVRGGA